jgi:hypothetical protein
MTTTHEFFSYTIPVDIYTTRIDLRKTTHAEDGKIVSIVWEKYVANYPDLDGDIDSVIGTLMEIREELNDAHITIESGDDIAHEYFNKVKCTVAGWSTDVTDEEIAGAEASVHA